MATTSKIEIQDGDQVIELTGAAKETFLVDAQIRIAERELVESELQAKKQARIDAITKLGEASGLTAQEIEAILNI